MNPRRFFFKKNRFLNIFFQSDVTYRFDFYNLSIIFGFPQKDKYTHTYTLTYLMTFEIQITYLLVRIDNGHADHPYTLECTDIFNHETIFYEYDRSIFTFL